LFDVCEEWVDQTSIYFNEKMCNLPPLHGGGDALSKWGTTHFKSEELGPLLLSMVQAPGFGIYDVVCKL
jgi:hypothetical protein